MSVFKTTFSRALRAHPSDNANIAYPTVVTSGTNTSAVATNPEDNMEWDMELQVPVLFFSSLHASVGLASF